MLFTGTGKGELYSTHTVNRKVLFTVLLLLLIAISIVFVAYLTVPSHHPSTPPSVAASPTASPPGTQMFVAPEYGWDALLALLASFASLAVFKTQNRRKKVAD